MQTHESRPRPERLAAPTYTPAIVAVALTVIAWGAVTTIALVLLGFCLLVLGAWRWIGEIRREH